MRFSRTHCALVLLPVLCSCHREVPRGQYSGDIVVVNNSEQRIYVIEITGFGSAEPIVGILGPTVDKRTISPPLLSVPSSTTIHWRLEEGTERMSQTLEYARIMKRGVPGKTEFEFSKEQQWAVRFHPE